MANNNPLLNFINHNVNMAQDLLGRNPGLTNPLLPNANQSSFPIPPARGIQDNFLQNSPNNFMANNQMLQQQQQNNQMRTDGLMPNQGTGLLNPINNTVPFSAMSGMMMGNARGFMPQQPQQPQDNRSMMNNNQQQQQGFNNNMNNISRFGGTQQDDRYNDSRNDGRAMNDSRNNSMTDQNRSLDYGRADDLNYKQDDRSRNQSSDQNNRDQNNRNQQNRDRSRDRKSPPRQSDRKERSRSPSRNRKNETLTEKAFTTDLTEDFFRKIKDLPRNQDYNSVCLTVARREFLHSKGEDAHRHKPGGIGHHSCSTCQMNFLSKEKLSNHYNTLWHKELDDLYRLKKEQARLISDNRITATNKLERLKMMSLNEAEREMKLKATSVDLDSYILGIYESVMKAYWPVPKTKHYCRVCNYKEFRSTHEIDQHKSSRDHKSMENSYDIAFCLYCQTHMVTAKEMERHKQNSQHKKIADLMDRTKQCAIERWHKENKIELPQEYRKPAADPAPPVGGKRTAPKEDPSNTSPTKKINSSSSSKGLSDRDRAMFVPMTGYMCVACKTYVQDSKEQESHVKLSSHISKVNSLKKLLS